MAQTYCIFSANYLPNIGGVEKYTENLAVGIHQLGNRVIIVTSNVFNLPHYERLDNGVEIVRLPCFNALGGRLPVPRRNAEYRQQMQWLDNQQVEYVSINTRFYPHSREGVKFAQRKGIIPLVVDHGSAHLTLGNPVVDFFVSSYEHFATLLLKRYPADFYAVSKASVAWLTHFNIEAKGVLFNAIDADAFSNQSSKRDFRKEEKLPENAFVVAFTGRFIPEKGIESLMQSAQILTPHRDIHFLLAGDGPLRPLLEQKAPSNIHLLGRLNAPDVAALLSTADALCLPTRSEGFSTSLLEAAACNTTPLVTDVGGVAELVPSSEYGIVLKDSSAKEITNAIMVLRDSPSLNKELAKNFAQRVRSEFTWDITAHQTIEACKAAHAF